MNGKLAIVILAGALISGCIAPEPISLNSNSAPSEIPAIKLTASNHDRAAVPRLVQDLNDPDSAVRFAAINALRQMTGEDLGYRYYDDETERKPAIQRWRDWLKQHPAS